jgi:hypothetical protein
MVIVLWLVPELIKIKWNPSIFPKQVDFRCLVCNEYSLFYSPVSEPYLVWYSRSLRGRIDIQSELICPLDSWPIFIWFIGHADPSVAMLPQDDRKGKTQKLSPFVILHVRDLTRSRKNQSTIGHLLTRL